MFIILEQMSKSLVVNFDLRIPQFNFNFLKLFINLLTFLKNNIIPIVSSSFHHDTVKVTRQKSCKSILVAEEAQDDHHETVVMQVNVLAASALVVEPRRQSDEPDGVLW